ncbi:MAG: hypothetical protein WCP21_02525 [Armatimonadota bacterium]
MNTRHLARAALLGLFAALLAGCPTKPVLRSEDGVVAVPRLPRLSDDLSGVVFPANLAPLSFSVREPGVAYHVAATADGEPAGEAFSRDGNLRLPAAEWKQALGEHTNLSLTVSVQGADGRWQRFAPVRCTKGPPIDRYLVYRQIGPVYNYYSNIRIRERDLQGYGERTVLGSGQLGGGCVNCHTFHAGRTERMTINVRGQAYGDHALLAVGNQITKMAKPWGYNSWHPGGQVVAYSLNKVRQFFHDAGAEVRDVVDLDSDIVAYRLDTGTVVTAPDLADPNRLETYPYWSADGKYLYYCSAPILWTNREYVPPKRYAEVRYDLRRIAYDAQTGQFGRAETVLAAATTGKSILLPRPSPDGKWLLFCMCDYGCFPIFQPSSDLYLMDVRTGQYRRLEINSDRAEAWHSWSSDSQWIAFSSKRRDGLLTRTYLAHVDAAGKVTKPLLVPQSDPQDYDGSLKTASVPELVTEPVRLTAQTLGAAARGRQQVSLKLPAISMTRKPAKPTPTEGWQQQGR